MRDSISVSACSAFLFRDERELTVSVLRRNARRHSIWNAKICGQTVALGFILVAAVCLRAADGKLEVNFFDVGQADAALVTCPDGKHHLLIDSGDNRYPNSSKNFRAYLINAFPSEPRHLDIVVASHAHADHIGSMEWVLKNFRVDTYIDNGDIGDTTTFGNLQKERRKQERAGTLNYVNGKQASFSDVDFCPSVQMEIFAPWGTEPDLSDPNDRSVAVRLDYKGKSFLFVGDIEGRAEEVMLNQFTEAQRAKLNVDVLKVGHHGSDTSSRAGFIIAVSPEIAVVSVGKKGVGTNVRYKHPRLSTMRSFHDWFTNHPPAVVATAGKFPAYDADTEIWKQQTRPKGMWLTVKDGTVTVTWDGQEWKVKTSPTQN